MKVLILGGVAAGTKTAAKLKREDRNAEVVLLSKSSDISYAGCGLPYYVGGLIESREELIVNTPQKYAGLTGVEVHTGVEAVAVDPAAKTVRTVDVATGAEATHTYDKLVIATGASPMVPPVEGAGLPGVFTVRTPDDAIAIRQYVQQQTVKKAVVVGAGFIGLEMAENLQAQGVQVTVIDFAAQLLPNIVDTEIATYIQKHLLKQGIRVLTSTKADCLEGADRVSGVRTAAGLLAAELVVMAAGIRPNTAFLQGSEIGRAHV